MRFGLLMANQHPPSTSVAARFAETIDRCAWPAMWVLTWWLWGSISSTEFQMLQPAVVAARLAAETGPMRLGTTIYSTSSEPGPSLRSASLDVITGGRFVLGAGLGYGAVEDEAFGLGQGERVPRLRQHLEVVKRLWAGDTVTFDSPYCRLVDARLEVRPIQQPHPPIWIAANNDRAVERAAELGDAWVINPHATLHTIGRQMGLYRTALARLGKPFQRSCR